MDKLKRYIDEHREAFDSESLPLYSEHRFDQRLRLHSRRSFRPFLWVASAAAVGLLLLFQWFVPSGSVNHSERAVSEELSFNDVSTYYTGQIDRLKDSICVVSHCQEGGPGSSFCEEAQRLYNEKLAFEQEELPLLPRTEEGFGVLHTFYTTKMENLEQILSLVGKNNQ